MLSLSTFNNELFEEALDMLLKLSDRCLEPYVKERIRKFKSKPHTSLELYDFLDSISKIPCERIIEDGKTVACVGDIDGFTQALCDVTKYYLRPTE